MCRAEASLMMLDLFKQFLMMSKSINQTFIKLMIKQKKQIKSLHQYKNADGKRFNIECTSS